MSQTTPGAVPELTDAELAKFDELIAARKASNVIPRDQRNGFTGHLETTQLQHYSADRAERLVAEVRALRARCEAVEALLAEADGLAASLPFEADRAEATCDIIEAETIRGISARLHEAIGAHRTLVRTMGDWHYTSCACGWNGGGVKDLATAQRAANYHSSLKADAPGSGTRAEADAVIAAAVEWAGRIDGAPDADLRAQAESAEALVLAVMRYEAVLRQKGGVPPAAPAAADAELVALQEALTFIRDNKHCAYDENASDSYGTGVTDGHRYCANVARAALMGLPNPYTAPDFKKAMDALYSDKETCNA